MSGIYETMTGHAPPSPAALPSTTSSQSVAQLMANALPQNGPQTVPGYEPPGSAPKNPLSYVAGMIGNIPGDVGEIVTGLSNLVKGGVHDIAGGILQAIPGEQGGLERSIEEQGYMFSPSRLLAMGQMVGNDYQSRYGFGEGGIGEMANQIYENPLSYVLDFLMVGGAAAKGAKIAGKLGWIPDELVTKIRGISPELEANALLGGDPAMARPTAELFGMYNPTPETVGMFGTEVGGGSLVKGATNVGLSTNPAKRFLQNQVIKYVMTRSNNATQKLFYEGKWGALGLGQEGPASGLIPDIENIFNAVPESARFMRAGVEKFVGNKWGRRVMGLTNQSFYERRNDALAGLRLLHDEAEKLGVPDPRIVDQFQLTDETMTIAKEGMYVPPQGMPNEAAKVINGLDELPNTDQPLQMDVWPTSESVGDPDVVEGMGNVFHGGPKPGDVTEPVYPPNFVPDNPMPGQVEGAPFNAFIGSMDDVPNALRQYGDKAGAVLEAVDDGLGKGSLWPGVTAYYRLLDGRRIALNVTTPELYGVQKVISHLRLNNQSLDKALSQYEIAIQALAGEEASAGGELGKLAESVTLVGAERTAAEAFARDYVRIARRMLANPEGYDPTMYMTDKYKLWGYEYMTKPWVKHYLDSFGGDWAGQGIQGPYTTAMNRAFGPMRLTLFYESVLKNLEDGFRQIIKDTKGKVPANELAEAIKEQALDYMDAWGIHPMLQEEIIKKFPIRLEEGVSATGAPLRDTAVLLRERARQVLRPSIVTNPTANGWEWENLAEVVPQLPTYYPHVRTVTPSQLLSKASQMPRKTTPEFSRGWHGVIMEEGTMSTDVTKVLSRVSSAYIRHEELGEAVTRLMRIGREVSQEELATWKGGRQSAEVLFNPEGIKSKLGLHAQLLDEIFAGVNDGKSYLDAVEEATKVLNEQIQGGLFEASASKVYALPKHVANQFSRVYLRSFAPDFMRMFYDGPMNLWRATVLGMNPRWMINNEMGNIVFTGIDRPLAIRRIFSQVERKNFDLVEELLAGTKVTSEESSLLNLSKRGFYTSENALMTRNWGSAADRYPNWVALADRTLESKIGRVVRTVPNFIRAKNAMMEQAARRGIMLDAYAEARLGTAARGMVSNLDLAKMISREGLTPALAHRMYEAANKTLGDYVTMSAVERDLVRRFLVPFYPFYRHVLKFTLRMPWDHPLKSAVFMQLNEMDKDMRSMLPEYLQGSIYVGQLGGRSAYWNLRQWNPLNAVLAASDSPLNLMAPLPKVALQAYMGVNDFGEPYWGDDVYEAGNGMRFIRTSSGWEPFTGRSHPPLWKMVAEQFGTPFNYMNLQGYKNPTIATRLMGQAGLSISRFDDTKYAQNVLEGMMQAMTYGGQ